MLVDRLPNQEFYLPDEVETLGVRLMHARTGHVYSLRAMYRQRKFVRMIDGQPWVVRGRDGEELVHGPCVFVDEREA